MRASFRRWVILGLLLTTTMAAGAWLEMRGDEQKPIHSRPTNAPAASTRPLMAAADTLELRLDRMETRTPGQMQRDPFASKTPATRKVRAAGPKRPVAPPLPFVFAGKFTSGPDTAVFLTSGDRNLVVHEGDTIDSTYRVETVGEAAITFVYLPLGERQSIAAADEPQ